MNKPEFLKAVARKSGLTQGDCERALDGIIVTITEELAKGNDLRIADLGKFEVKRRPAQKGRNPRTQEPMDIPASNMAKFKPAKALKDAVN